MTVLTEPSIERAFKKVFNEQLDQIVPVVANSIIAVVLTIVFAVTIIGILAIPALWGGYIKSIIDVNNGEQLQIGKFISPGFNKFGAMLGASLISVIGIGLGLICFVIPGIYLMVRWVFVPYLIMNENLEISDAFRVSGQLVNGRWWDIFVMVLIVELLETILTWTGIGIILGVPFSTGVTAQYYLDLSTMRNSE